MAYHILCTDDDPDFLIALKLSLKEEYQISTAQNEGEALEFLSLNSVDLLLLDINLGNTNGLELLQQIKSLYPYLDVVMLTGRREPEYIVTAIRNGAADYLCKPFNQSEIQALIEKLQRIKMMRDRHDALIAGLNSSEKYACFLGNSNKFKNIIEQVRRLQGHSANILIYGESGTGKELLARHIHAMEKEPKRPFIAVNCAAIPEGLIESELFGHERGAFTGAVQRKIGKFELANGGDIFLDEISSLRLDLQSKILRVLQEREICRVGGSGTIHVDFRVIAATNEDLYKKVAKNGFRSDLYHRLRVVELNIPPLRERIDDIPLLITHFLDKYSTHGGKKEITAAAIEKLQRYPWPGNVRELENVIHSLVILSPLDLIDTPHLPKWLAQVDYHAFIQDPQAPFVNLSQMSISQLPLKKFVQQAERIYIQRVLSTHEGDKNKTADALRIGRTTLYGKMKELGIE